MSNATNLISNKHPDSCPALVLNADFRPLSYYPLSLWSWQDAIKAVFLDRVNIVSSYDRAVHSPSFEIKLPSVVSLKIMLSLRNGRLLLDLIYFLEISLVVNIVVQLQILLLIICYLVQREGKLLGRML